MSLLHKLEQIDRTLFRFKRKTNVDIKKYMILSSACRKTGEPDATRTAQVLRLNPSLKQKKKKKENSAHWDLIWKKYICIYMYIKQVCVPGEDVYTFYRKLQLSDSSTEPCWVTKVNWTLAALANLFLGQTCGFTNAACWKKNKQKTFIHPKSVLPAQGHIMTTDHHYSVLFYCFHPCAGAWFFGFVKKNIPGSLFKVCWSKGWHIILRVCIAGEKNCELATWSRVELAALCMAPLTEHGTRSKRVLVASCRQEKLTLILKRCSPRQQISKSRCSDLILKELHERHMPLKTVVTTRERKSRLNVNFWIIFLTQSL